MSEAKPGTTRDADLSHLKEYLDNLSTITGIAVAAGADLKIYNSLCARLNQGSRDQ